MDKIINKYKINLNEEGYVIGFYAIVEGDYDYEGQMADYPNACEGYTKFTNGQFVVDETKKQEIETRKAKENRIAELKQKLNDTDYIYNSIREGGRTEEYYAEVIENRKAWRKEIQELEEELGL